MQKLKHHGSVNILSGNRSNPNVGALDVEEAGTGYIGDRRSNLLACVNHVHTEGINSIASNIISEYSGYKNLSFVIVDEQSPNHFGKWISPKLIKENYKSMFPVDLLSEEDCPFNIKIKVCQRLTLLRQCNK
uniref:Uncharacterized protein n=1 Tax=Arion vulgaris TaxID=1028688 RepID=A0A0B7A0U5_9EUPU